jgi:signal peptide peptidase SppA
VLHGLLYYAILGVWRKYTLIKELCMSHTLFRLTESLLSQPLLMTQSSCENVLSYLDFRNTQSLVELTQLATNAEKNYGGVNVLSENGIGTINVFGSLTTNKTGFEAFCGNTSYEGIAEQAKALFSSPDVHTVLLNVRSGGGQAHKVFEQSLMLQRLASSSGKRLIAYVDEMAASAAYALAVAADEIIINPTAQAGSIGVLIQLVNNNEQLKKEGIERTFITSCDGKVPFNSEGEFREEFKADLQDKVSVLYEDFVNHVAALRGITPEVIKATNAGVFSAEKSLQLGLVDKIMETEAFYEYLADLSEHPTNTSSKQVSKIAAENVTTLKQTKKDTKSMSAELQVDPTEFAKLQAQMEQQAAQLAAYQAKETKLATEALSAKLDNSPFLAECKEPLLNFFMSSDVSEAHKELMNSVIGAANASNESVVADAAAQVTEALAQVEAAQAEVETVKAEFATSVNSVQLEVKDQVQGSNVLAEKIAKLKAAQAK